MTLVKRAGRVQLRFLVLWWTASLSLWSCTVSADPGGAAIKRDPFDQGELDSMRAHSAGSAEVFEEGEKLAAAGQLEEALVRFAKIKAGMPNLSLPHRRYCETMTALGRGSQALDECLTALQIMRTKFAVRAVVRALVTGPATPTMQNVSKALWLLGTEQQNLPPRFELSSALCDIAERIGDGPMLQHCTEDLLGLAPNAPETRQALTLLDARCPRWQFWAGWLFVAAAVVGTLAHMCRRLIARSTRHGPALGAAGALIAAIHLSAGTCCADPLPPAGSMLSKWSIDDKDPESSIPSEADRNKDPLNFGYWLQDLIVKASGASKHGDHEAAVRYYRAMAKAVPDRSIGFSKLCAEYEALQDLDKAIASCGTALLSEGVTVSDYAQYVHLVLSKPSLASKDEETLKGVIDTLKADPKAHPIVDEVECEFGARTANANALSECVPALVARAPKDLRTIRYRFALALATRRFDDAFKVLDDAKAAGMKPDAVLNMERTLRDVRGRSLGSISLALLAAGFFAVALFFVIRFVLKARRASPEATTTQTTAATGANA